MFKHEEYKIFTDPFINSSGRVREYSTDFTSFVPYVCMNEKTREEILEDPEKINFLDKNSPSYSFMKFYYMLITKSPKSFNSKTFRSFKNNSRVIQLFKERLDEIITNIEDQNLTEDFLHEIPSLDKKILELILDYFFEKKDKENFVNVFECICSKKNYDVSRLEKYFTQNWVIKNICLDTYTNIFNNKCFINKVFNSSQKIIDAYVGNQLKFHPDDETFFELLTEIVDQEVLKKIIIAFNKAHDKSITVLKHVDKYSKYKYHKEFMYKKFFEDKSEVLIKNYVKNDFCNLINFYFEFRDLNLFRFYIFFEGEYILNPFYDIDSDIIIQIINKFEGVTIINDKNKYEKYLSIIRDENPIKLIVDNFYAKLEQVIDDEISRETGGFISKIEHRISNFRNKIGNKNVEEIFRSEVKLRVFKNVFEEFKDDFNALFKW